MLGGPHRDPGRRRPGATAAGRRAPWPVVRSRRPSRARERTPGARTGASPPTAASVRRVDGNGAHLAQKRCARCRGRLATELEAARGRRRPGPRRWSPRRRSSTARWTTASTDSKRRNGHRVWETRSGRPCDAAAGGSGSRRPARGRAAPAAPITLDRPGRSRTTARARWPSTPHRRQGRVLRPARRRRER